MLLSILQNSCTLQHEHVWNVPVIKSDIEPVTFIAVCADAQLAIKVIQPNDLVRRMSRNNLLSDCLKLKQWSEWAYLIVAGDLRPASMQRTSLPGDAMIDGKRSEKKGDWARVSNILLKVQETGVTYVQVESHDQVVEMVHNIAQQDRSTKRVKPARDVVFAEPAEDILLSLDGIGEKTCDALLQYTGGNAAHALAILTDDTYDFPNIGPGIRAKVRACLGMNEDTVIAVHLKLTEQQRQENDDLSYQAFVAKQATDLSKLHVPQEIPAMSDKSSDILDLMSSVANAKKERAA